MAKPTAVRVGNITVAPISARQRKILEEKIKKRYERLRRRHPEVHGKIVDWVSHSLVEDGSLYVSIRFMDKTEFFLAVQCRNPDAQHRFIGHAHREFKNDSGILQDGR